MNFDHFKKIVAAFADRPTDLDFSKGLLVAQIRDEMIEARLSLSGGDVFVEENGDRQNAVGWIVNRVARLPLLAERILAFGSAKVPHFVVPNASVVDQLEVGNGEEFEADDAMLKTVEILGRRPAGTTSVLYVTSDAGEGKTTLINQIARAQAEKYKAHETDWLLVPIPLGGRAFLRFDDVTIAALVNRLRFPFFYYEAFLELVRLGVLIPAFDGFEEMFVEGSSGEAVSALGNLVNSLQSSGSVLVAARKAFFEYRSFVTQARLFDAIESDSVSFARVALHRWEKRQFIEYAKARQYAQPEVLYDRVADRLGAKHPILTRAVLVRRLLDVAVDRGDLDTLLNQVGSTPQDYFYQFVNAIVEREASQKWLDKANEAASPLLSVEEHHELLASIAQEMWITATNALRADVLDVVADVFSESKKKAPSAARQIRDRIKDHPLLVASDAPKGTFAFDHEDFREFFLGQAVGAALARRGVGDLTELLRVGALPRETGEHAALFVARKAQPNEALIPLIQKIGSEEPSGSFGRENASGLAVALLHHLGIKQVELSNLNFPADSLRGRRLESIRFKDCYFQATSIDAWVSKCTFEKCRFERLELNGSKVTSALINCEVGSLYRRDRDDQLYDPSAIAQGLREAGFDVKIEADQVSVPRVTRIDPEIDLVERVLRIFLRASHANENVIRQRLGIKSSAFFDKVLPQLLKKEILEETSYQGSGQQRRFRLNVPMRDMQEHLVASKGSFGEFLRRF